MSKFKIRLEPFWFWLGVLPAIIAVSIFVLSLSSCSNNNGSTACLPSQLPSSNCVAQFPFTNGGTTDIINGLQLQVHGSLLSALDRNGASCAIEFDGNNYLFADATPLFTNGFLSNNDTVVTVSFSVSLWFKTGTNNPGEYNTLISLGSGLNCPDKEGVFSLGLYDCNKVYLSNEVSAFEQNCPSGASAWKHIVATYNAASKTLALYINGSLVSSVSGAAQCSGGWSITDVDKIFVGKNYQGYIDDIVFYNTDLNSQQVQLLYNAGTCCL